MSLVSLFLALEQNTARIVFKIRNRLKEDIEENSRKEKGKRINEIPSGKDMEYAEFL